MNNVVLFRMLMRVIQNQTQFKKDLEVISESIDLLVKIKGSEIIRKNEKK